MAWRGFAPRLCVVLGYVVLSVAFAWPLPLHLTSAVLGPISGDTGVYIWNQWIFQYELAHRGNPFATNQILSLTQSVDLSQHNYTTFLNVLALPLIPFLGVVATFNVVYLGATVLTALSTYVLVRQVTNANRPIAWLSGALFAWSPVLVARSTAHMSLVAAAPLPIFILCLLKLDETRRTVWAALTGACVAWAAFCDVYFAVYCVMIAAAFAGAKVMRIRRAASQTRGAWIRTIETLLVCTGGLIAGLALGGGGDFTFVRAKVHVHSLYTPTLVFTALLLIRLAHACTLERQLVSLQPRTLVKIVATAFIACAGPLSPVLYGLSRRIFDGSFVSPEIFWRSSPRGVDLLALFEPNPNHFLVRVFSDRQATDATAFVDYTAPLSLVALVVVTLGIIRGYRPPMRWLALTFAFIALSLGPFVIAAGHNTYIPGPWALLRYVPVIGLARSPARFAIVSALGVTMLFAGAATFLMRKSSRPRLFMAIVGGLLLFELCAAPRHLYSSEIPNVYRVIAEDPRPVRVLELPFGIRDGTFSVGNYSARSQYYQTLHHKRLVGGYLSRISKRRIAEHRAQPTIEALLTLSEGRSLSPEQLALVKDRAGRFLERSRLGYVVIDSDRASSELISFVTGAWQLQEVARDGNVVLLRPTLLVESKDEAER